MANGNGVPLREYLEAKLDAIQSLIEVRLAERERALQLQASEYERRLQDLNNAHERAEKVLGTYQSKETAERVHESIILRIEALERSDLQHRTQFGMLAAGLALFLTVVSIAGGFIARAIWG